MPGWSGSEAARPAAALVSLLLLGQLVPALSQGGETFSRWVYPSGLSCPQLSIDKLMGSSASEAVPDVSGILTTQSSLTAMPGMLFIPPRRFAVGRSVDLGKPLVMPQGAVLDIARGATLSIRQPLSVGPWQVFAGAGSVRFQPMAGLRILPEWFGAAGDGEADDAPAIDAAFKAANASGADVLFSAGRTYGIRSTILKPEGMRIFSEAGKHVGRGMTVQLALQRCRSTLKALQPGLTGMLFEPGGHLRPDVLPAFRGFSIAIEYDDTGMVDSYTPFIGPLPGLPCKEGLRLNADSVRIKFGTIQDCQTGVHVTTRTAERTVMQGVTIEGEEFVDTSGVAKQVYLYTAVSLARPPYWDHLAAKLGAVRPHPGADDFAMVRSNVLSGPFGLPFHTYEIGFLGALPRGGRLIDSQMSTSVLRVRPQVGFPEGSLDYKGGEFNSIYFDGPAAAWTLPPLKLATQPDSLPSFKAANDLMQAIWQNAVTVQTPGRSWKAGDTGQFYMYHQLVYDSQQMFMTIPQWGSRCIDGKLAVTAVTDNSAANKYEVVLQVVACQDFSGPLTFPVAIGAASA